MNSTVDKGRCGGLIKNFALQKNRGVHDYLYARELVENILNYKYPDKYNLILNQFQKITSKCIIEFKSEKEFHPDRLSKVINYLYHKINKLEMDYTCNVNISNLGRTISPNMIVSINYL